MALSTKEKKVFEEIEDRAYKLCFAMGKIVYDSKNATLRRIIKELRKEKVKPELISDAVDMTWNNSLNSAIKIVIKELTTKKK